MDNMVKCVLAETVMEGLMGASIGTVLQRVVYPN